MLTRFLGILGLIGVFFIMAQDFPWAHQLWFDLNAALLVFVTPWFILLIFRKDRVSIKFLLSRIQQNQKLENKALCKQIQDLTQQMTQTGIRADLVKLAEDNPDSFVRYCAQIYNAKFESQELAALMQQKLENEDEIWQQLNLVFGFLAKMAPYFGMLATVLGMIHLLKNMQDFSKISSGMALALQGTLYGLISFTLIYMPLQKWCTGLRELIYRRNSMVAHWFLMLSEKREPGLILANLEIEAEPGKNQ